MHEAALYIYIILDILWKNIYIFPVYILYVYLYIVYIVITYIYNLYCIYIYAASCSIYCLFYTYICVCYIVCKCYIYIVCYILMYIMCLNSIKFVIGVYYMFISLHILYTFSYSIIYIHKQ